MLDCDVSDEQLSPCEALMIISKDRMAGRILLDSSALLEFHCQQGFAIRGSDLSLLRFVLFLGLTSPVSLDAISCKKVEDVGQCVPITIHVIPDQLL